MFIDDLVNIEKYRLKYKTKVSEDKSRHRALKKVYNTWHLETLKNTHRVRAYKTSFVMLY